MKKKVCFVIPRAYEYFFPGIKPVGGGAEKQIFILSTGLSKYENFEVNVCLADFGQDEFMSKDNIKFWRIHKLNDNKIVGFRKIQKALKHINADVYVFMAANLAIYFFVRYIQIFLKKKVVYMIAGDAEIKFSTLKKESDFLTAILMQKTHQISDLLIVQNEYQLQVEKQRCNKPTVLILNPIEINENTASVDDKVGALWVGRLHPIKQIELLFKLAERFPDEQFTMIGNIVPEYEEYGKHIAKEVLKYSNIRYIGGVPNNEILQYFEKAKVYLMTSKMEGFSNTMMEAMLSKCAVLSLNVNPNGLFSSNENGLFANGNFDLYLSQFKELMSDDKLVEKLGSNAHNYIVKHHKMETIVAQLAESLNDIFKTI